MKTFFEPIAGMAAFLTLAGFLVLLWVGLAYIIGIFMGFVFRGFHLVT